MSRVSDPRRGLYVLVLGCFFGGEHFGFGLIPSLDIPRTTFASWKAKWSLDSVLHRFNATTLLATTELSAFSFRLPDLFPKHKRLQ